MLAIPELVHFQANFKDNLCMHECMYVCMNELGVGFPPCHSPPSPLRQSLSLNLVLMFYQLGWKSASLSVPPIFTFLGAKVIPGLLCGS